MALLDGTAAGAGAFVAHIAVLGDHQPLSNSQAGVLSLALPLVVALGGLRGGYQRAALFSAGRQLRSMLPAIALAWIMALLAALAFGEIGRVNGIWAFCAAALGGALVAFIRAGVATSLRESGTRNRVALRTVIVGGGPQAARLVEHQRRRGQCLRILGIADDRPGRRGSSIAGVPYLGSVPDVVQMVRRGEVDQIVIALPLSAEDRAVPLAQHLADLPVHLRLAPELVSYHLPPCGRTDLDGTELIHLRDRPISGWQAVVKTLMDYGFGIAALAIAAVPMALIALAIRLDSPGPILFRQRRTGFNNQDFDVLKFRTMYDHATDHEVTRQVREGDPRVTRVGALLRKTSLDELPQIFNVLRGEMSFVGPRPHAPGTRAGGRRFEEVVARYAARHRVKPGLTGLAQVRGWRGATETEEKLIRRVESDLEYIENWSPWLDLVIILRTLVVVALMKNAH